MGAGSSSIHHSSQDVKYFVTERKTTSSLGDENNIINNGNIGEHAHNNDKTVPQIIPQESMGLENVINHMRFFQNLETSEVIFILGSDNIEDVPKLEKEEWFEVYVSGLQDDYVRQTMQSKTFAQRQFFNSKKVDDTASLSTDTQAAPLLLPSTSMASASFDHLHSVPSSVPSPVCCEGEDDGFTINDDHLIETNSAQISPSSSSSGNSGSVTGPSDKVHVPWECPHCDHTFSHFENKNQHIAECRSADEEDKLMIKQWIELITHNNVDVMSEAITEAIRQFEEKVYHRKTVLLLLKQLRAHCRKGSVEQLQALAVDFSVEQREISLLVVPAKKRNKNDDRNINNNAHAMGRNEELNMLMDYLKKGAAILKRKIASKNTVHIEDFTVGNILSTGSFSTVHLAKCNANDKLYALKVMKRDFLREQKMVSIFECEFLLS